MRRTIPLFMVGVLVLAGCGGGGSENAGTATPPASTSASTTMGSPTASPASVIRTDFDLPPYGELVEMWDYDRSKPLGYEVNGSERQGDVTTYDIVYRSSGFAVPAYLVVPNGQGPFPVVLYAHGYGLDRSFYLDDAVALAHQGYAGLVIQGPGPRPPWVEFFSFNATKDIRGHVQYVTDLRRGLDLLQTLPDIDGSRIGFVGHSLGCQMGGILSGIEERIDAYVLMCCVGYANHPEWWCPPCFSGSDEQLVNYQQAIAVLNPVNYLPHSQGTAFLVQASKYDEYGATVPNIRALFDAAPSEKSLRWYEFGHDLGCFGFRFCDPALPAFVDHRAWLEENL